MRSALGEEMKLFGRRVRVAMAEQGLKVEDLAEMTGIHRGTLSRVRNGRQALKSLDSVKALAAALGVSLDFLVHGETKRRD